MKKIMVLLLSLFIALCFGACGKKHVHTYSEATCITPATCSCGETKGDVIEHQYSEATCTAPATCSCGKIKGDVIEHQYSDATCTTPATCSCGETKGDVIEHQYSKATCFAPMTCYMCDKTKGEEKHDWKDGKCQKCSRIRDPYYKTVFLDEFAGVSFTYKGIKKVDDVYELIIDVKNSTNEIVSVYLDNARVNGHKSAITMYDILPANSTTTVDISVIIDGSYTFDPPLKYYGEEMVKYVSFNFHLNFNDRTSNAHIISTKNIVLYPYSD